MTKQTKVRLLSSKQRTSSATTSQKHEDGARFEGQGRDESQPAPGSRFVMQSLADFLADNYLHPLARETGNRLLLRFLSRGMSPRSRSFHLVKDGEPQRLARETAKRFLLAHLLTMYANLKSGCCRRRKSPYPELVAEGLEALEEDLRSFASPLSVHHTTIGRLLYGLIPSGALPCYVHDIRESVVQQTLSINELTRLVSVLLFAIRAGAPADSLWPDLKQTGT